MISFNWSQYRTNLSLYVRGFRWLWTRQVLSDQVFFSERYGYTIGYKTGWTPLTFCLGVYWWDYGLNVLAGGAVESLSRRFKLLGRDHWGHTGPALWGSRSAWG